jgi:hypothetical protein
MAASPSAASVAFRYLKARVDESREDKAWEQFLLEKVPNKDPDTKDEHTDVQRKTLYDKGGRLQQEIIAEWQALQRQQQSEQQQPSPQQSTGDEKRDAYIRDIEERIKRSPVDAEDKPFAIELVDHVRRKDRSLERLVSTYEAIPMGFGDPDEEVLPEQIPLSYVKELARTGGPRQEQDVKDKAEQAIAWDRDRQHREREIQKARDVKPRKISSIDDVKDYDIITHAEFPGVQGRIDRDGHIDWYDDKGKHLNYPRTIGRPKADPSTFPPQWGLHRDVIDQDALDSKDNPWSHYSESEVSALWHQPETFRRDREALVQTPGGWKGIEGYRVRQTGENLFHEDEGREHLKVVPRGWNHEHEIFDEVRDHLSTFASDDWVEKFRDLDETLSRRASRNHPPGHDPSDMDDFDREQEKFELGAREIGKLFMEEALTPEERKIWEQVTSDLHELREVSGVSDLKERNKRREENVQNPVGREGAIELIELLEDMGAKGKKSTYSMHTPLGRTKIKVSDEDKKNLRSAMAKAMAFSRTYFELAGLHQVRVSLPVDSSRISRGEADDPKKWEELAGSLDVGDPARREILEDPAKHGVSLAQGVPRDHWGRQEPHVIGTIETARMFLGPHTGLPTSLQGTGSYLPVSNGNHQEDFAYNLKVPPHFERGEDEPKAPEKKPTRRRMRRKPKKKKPKKKREPLYEETVFPEDPDVEAPEQMTEEEAEEHIKSLKERLRVASVVTTRYLRMAVERAAKTQKLH